VGIGTELEGVGEPVINMKGDDFLHFPRGTSIGISMFAWMSGYLLANRYERFGIDYYKKRLLRIYPTVFWVIAFGVFWQGYVMGVGVTPDVLLLLIGGSKIIFPHARFQGIGGGMWFVSFVLICYMLLPIVKGLIRQRAELFLSLVVVGMGIWIISFRSLPQHRLDVLFYESFVWFCLGVFCSQKNTQIRVLSSETFIGITFVISWLGILYFQYFNESLIVQYVSIIIIPLWAFPMISKMGSAAAKSRLLKGCILFISTISFEIYLLHFYVVPIQYKSTLNIFNLGLSCYLFYCFFLTVMLAFCLKKISSTMVVALQNFFPKRLG